MQKLLLALLLLTAPALAQQARPAKLPKRPVAAKPAAVAYFCNSGNIVKYHASPSCRGLERCSDTIDPIALSTAQARMKPCAVCH